MPPSKTPGPGLHPLGMGSGQGRERDGLLMIPAGTEAPMPLLVLLHGAGGNAAGMLRLLEPQARQAGVALLLPESRGPTWDVVLGGLGPDVAFLDAALRRTFATIAVDPGRLAIGGFSDGASYALSLGLVNGALFRWVLAFSPGFIAAPAFHGRPRIFVSHGLNDNVLPIDRCSRPLVARLRQGGYPLRYEEFEGGHYLPEGAAAKALSWLSSGRN
ncbi:hypothetical protein IAI58_13265 [Roseomonas marmotae]|uniref:Phospholipase n=2 Tax=Roseomonas marmotae TaxID=2768161 RepID=A0ABS3K8E1_9PROT|nr:hypothetical protein [Roseomonas marmotae]QTI80977.1 hypothetical protein IAI58_13265 [Roseomonas marmotae]